MDPGTALSVVSVAFQLFGGCVQGFILLSGARNAGKVGSSLLCQLSIQELRLTEWAKRAGLLGSGALDVRLNQVVVESILHHLRDLLSDVDKLSMRYKLKLAIPPEGATDRFPKSHDKSHHVFGLAISDEIRREILWRAKLIQDRNMLPKRLWWAAVDRDRFQDMIAEVRTYVQELWSLLDPLVQDDMLRSQQLVLANVISIADKVDDVKALRDALSARDALADQFSRLMPLANIAAVKAARLESDESLVGSAESSVSSELTFVNTSCDVEKVSQKGDGSIKDPDSRNVKIDQNEVDLQDASDNQITHFRRLSSHDDIGLASYRTKTPVLVEWKSIPTANRWKLIRRVQQLARVLNVATSPNFRSLQCCALAMSDDATKAGFVFRLPHDGCRHAVSLRTILSGKSGLTAPSVDSRISLALSLSQSIQYFHTAGWMHKNLRSENILFFRREEVTKSNPLVEEELEEPYIVGFGYARLDATGEVSERPSTDPGRDIYRHPHALEGVSVAYQPFMDLHSLGTILIELAEWRPLSTLVKEVVDVKKNTVPLTQLASVRTYLFGASFKSTATVKLDFRMGRKYARAVRLCLGAETIDGGGLSKGGTAAESGNALSVLTAAIEELRACVV